ncbi:uncharacterized protein [Triticum aestivum]|uniref:uncharacterized protein n=1 Tax=Triticum aestivum TaxID=4565 RepID=UPI000844FC47|nr:uncharacterized protein LOC123141163 [Triticum aestivum]
MQTLTLPSAAHCHSAIEDLPDELLADILRRLPPRGLAACRSVCKHWRADVDAHGLLLAVAHLVPCPLRGIFVNYVMDQSLRFFSPAAPGTTSTSQSSIDVTLSFLPGQLSRGRAVLDHRSGLLLFENGNTMCVCNPVTRRWATLPPPPRVPPQHSHLRCYRRRMYLVFDPTVSLHYDVLFFPDVLDKQILQPAGEQQCSGADYDKSLGSMEWPPYMYPVQVFSSRNNRWEEKQFIRQGAAVVTVSDVKSDRMSPTSSRSTRRNHAVLWRASFYVHCDIGFIMRLSLEEQKYLVIKTPNVDTSTTGYNRCFSTYGYLAKSKQGVYYTAICGYQFHVWVLHNTSESSQTPEWELKHQVNLEPNLKPCYNRCFRRKNIDKCWILDSRDEESEDTRDYEWDSSDDSIADAEGEINEEGKDYYFALDLLGYHPYKEIAFLGNRFQGFAYQPQLNKHRRPSLPLLESFIYTPCMNDVLPCEGDHDE